jgi:hypothetical protein
MLTGIFRMLGAPADLSGKVSNAMPIWHIIMGFKLKEDWARKGWEQLCPRSPKTIPRHCGQCVK